MQPLTAPAHLQLWVRAPLHVLSLSIKVSVLLATAVADEEHLFGETGAAISARGGGARAVRGTEGAAVAVLTLALEGRALGVEHIHTM